LNQAAKKLEATEMVPLLQVSVAMGNGGAKLKALATFVAPSNDDNGVAVAIKLLLDGNFGDLGRLN
jgi:hydroxymethylpyrimidine pyrophosphatase-like HAD family hydrolase